MKRYVHVAFEDSSTKWYHDESNSLEVGRFVIVENRGQYVPAESGKVIFIGATTESPNYHMTRAIVSHCSLFKFKKVKAEDIKKAL